MLERRLSESEIKLMLKAQLEQHGHINVTVLEIQQPPGGRIFARYSSNHPELDAVEQQATKVEVAPDLNPEPAFSVGDTIILSAKSPEAQRTLDSYGRAWRVPPTSAGDYYIVTNLLPKNAGKFRGSGKGQFSVRLYKTPSRQDFKVEAVCRFPETFKWQDFKELLTP